MGIKQVIIIRKDLNMRKGKMCAQAAHASNKVLLERSAYMTVDYDEGRFFHSNAEIEEWINGKYRKVVCGVDSEEHLLSLYNEAKSRELPCSIITDAGLTEFDGAPAVTAIAIGPTTDEKVDSITGTLKLL